MNSTKYKNLRRYAAFLFMLFTVYSGSQEDLHIRRAARSLRGVSIYALKLQEMLAQGIQNVKDEESGEKSRYAPDGFNWIAGENGVHGAPALYQAVGIAAGGLFFALNNWMTRNNIWRRTVF